MNPNSTDRRLGAQPTAAVPAKALASVTGPHVDAAAGNVDLPADTLLPSVDRHGVRRHDLYVGIHKALRAFMADTLRRVGAMDPHDDAERQAVIGDLRDLIALCHLHLDDENRFIHPVIEAARPGAADRIAGEHVHHQAELAHLAQLADAVADAPPAGRDDASARLYRALAIFVAGNFEHMLFEETHHNAVLWSAHADAELAGIEGALVASIPPPMLQLSGLWMLRAFSHRERVGFVAGVRQSAPPELFALLMSLAREALQPRDLRKLERALALPVAEAA